MNWFTMLVSTIIVIGVYSYRFYDKFIAKRDTRRNSELQLKLISKAIDNMMVDNLNVLYMNYLTGLDIMD